jgi:hypothetical protein
MFVYSRNTHLELVKNILQNFSRLLRRDFLYVLVKTSAKQLQIPTSRDDWRTRDGMLAFIARNWNIISVLLYNQSEFVGWYAIHFQSSEKLLTDQKFAKFIHKNWVKYKEFFLCSSTQDFMQINQNYLSTLLNGNEEHIEEFSASEIGASFIEILAEFREEKRKSQKTQGPPQPQIQEQRRSSKAIDTNTPIVKSEDFDSVFGIFDDMTNFEDNAIPF